MKAKRLRTISWVIAIAILTHGIIFAQTFQVNQVTDKILILSNPDLGSQVVVHAEKGLVVFDSFWSEVTAEIFKNEIINTLDRNDFLYVVNMVDRLDMIGGNSAFPKALVVGQENIQARYTSEGTVDEELGDLIEMWREKEGYSRSRLENIEAGSKDALEEGNWMNKCITMADELENSFSLELPDISYKDKITLNIGNFKINLFWFGKAGNYRGLTMAVIPEEKVAVLSKAIVYPEYHLAPYPYPYYGALDVPRWINMLEMILEGENPVNKIILSDSQEVYSGELLHSHLNYIRTLWDKVNFLEDEGKSLQEIQDILSLEKDFAFVKEMQVYKKMGDSWIRPQHEMHVKLFFLQSKELASEIIRNGGPENLQVSLNKIKKLGNDVYFDEISMDRIGYEWMKRDQISEAIEVYKLNTEIFPESYRVFDSLGEAYLKKGDKVNAKINLERSLELNPNNGNIKKILDEL